ncbi:MAG: pilus assembly protein PilM, partial [Planctomycetes bacterium]|nr:pilus assembly protein PilM [Planctomycetota bacterium]
MPHWCGKKYSPIGLDLGQTAIRGIQLVHHKKNLEVHAALEQRLKLSHTDPIETENNVEIDPEYFTDQLKHLLDRGNFIGRDVVLHCPADKLDMRPIELPASGSAIPRSAILGALRLQMGGHLPFAVEDAVFDYFIINSNNQGDSIRVMAITAGGEWIKQRIELAESLGLHCLTVDALPCALARVSAHSDSYFSTNTPPPEYKTNQEKPQEKAPEALVGILDVGYTGSTLIVRNQNRPIFCRRFSFAGSKMTEIITNRLGVEYNLAEDLKQVYGLDCQARRLRQNENRHYAVTAEAENSSNQNQSITATQIQHTNKPESEIAKTIYAALQSELGHFVKGLTRSLNYIITDHGGARLENIQLCGSAGHT